MPFVVVLDANVLYSAPLRDLLIRLALAGLFQAKWTDRILDECFAAILQSRPDLDETRLERTRDLLNAAVRDCLVTGYEPLIDSLNLPDENDRHILAAAIRCKAQLIVTWNVSDFPDNMLEGFEVAAVDPDEFVMNQIDSRPDTVVDAVREQAATLKRPTRTTKELLETLKAQGLAVSSARLRDLIQDDESRREANDR